MRRSATTWTRAVAALGLLAAACDGGSRGEPPRAGAGPPVPTTVVPTTNPVAPGGTVVVAPWREPTFQAVAPVVYRPASGQLLDIAAGDNALWAIETNPEGSMRGQLVRLDPGTGRPLSSIPLSGYPIAVAAGGQLAWVLIMPAVPDLRVVGVEPASGRVVVDVSIPGPVRGEPPLAHLAVGGDAVWVAVKESTGGDRLLRLDPRSGRVVATIALPDRPTAIALGERLWIGTEQGRLLAVDRPSNVVAADVMLGGRVRDLAVDGQSGWATVSTPDGAVDLVRFDPRSPGSVTRTGIPVWVVAAGRGEVWVGDYGFPPPAQTGFVGQIDTRTNALSRSTGLPTVSSNGVAELAVGDGVVWALNRYTSTVTGIRPPD